MRENSIKNGVIAHVFIGWQKTFIFIEFRSLENFVFFSSCLVAILHSFAFSAEPKIQEKVLFLRYSNDFDLRRKNYFICKKKNKRILFTRHRCNCNSEQRNHLQFFWIFRFDIQSAKMCKISKTKEAKYNCTDEWSERRISNIVNYSQFITQKRQNNALLKNSEDRAESERRKLKRKMTNQTKRYILFSIRLSSVVGISE